MVEFVGIFSLDTAEEDVTAGGGSGSGSGSSRNSGGGDAMVVDFEGDDGMYGEGEGEAEKAWPASIAPRVHVLCYRRLGGSFPLVRTPPAVSSVSEQQQQQQQQQQQGCLAAETKVLVGAGATAMPASPGIPRAGAFAEQQQQPTLLVPDAIVRARGAVLALIRGALGGDGLAAEYVLLALLSRVVARREDALLGSLPLILSTSPGLISPDLEALVGVLRSFMPRAVLIKADLAALNAHHYCPEKDYTRNVLLPSPLQVGDGTALVIDETGMAEGTLGPVGMKSARALSCVVQRQSLPAKFAYCEVTVRIMFYCSSFLFLFVMSLCLSLCLSIY
jgi:hypothetical protein